MSQNTEEIEARLVEYIEGEIDDAGRAEIEKHLASNPSHRALLEDLKLQRQRVRGLPRASAPPDILEALEQHLERKLLLDEAPADAVAAIRPGIWPRVMALAAVLLLSGTLGLLIWSMLPSRHQISPELAALREPTPLADSPDVGGVPDVSRGPDVSGSVGGARTGSVPSGLGAEGAPAMAGSPPDAGPAPTGGDSVGGHESVASRAGTGASTLETGAIPDLPPTDLPRADIRDSSPPASSVLTPPVLVLLAEDSHAAAAELSRFALANRLHLEPVSLSESGEGRGGAMEPLPAADRSHAEHTAGSAERSILRDGVSADQGARRAVAPPATAPDSAGPRDAERAGRALAGGGAAGEGEFPNESIYAVRGISLAQAEIISQALAREPNLGQPVLPQQVAPAEQHRYAQYAQARQGGSEVLRALDRAGSAGAKEPVLPRQSSAPPEPGKVAAIDAPAAVPTGVGSAAGIVAAGDRLVIRLGAADARASGQEYTVTVGEDGGVSIPALKHSVPAIGLTCAELAQRLAEAMQAGKSGPLSAVTVERVPSDEVAVTDLVIVVRQNVAAPAARGSIRSRAAPPATQPATAPVGR